MLNLLFLKVLLWYIIVLENESKNIMKIKDQIIVKDNFFKQNVLKKIHNEILNLNFTNRFLGRENNVYQKIYFNAPLDQKHFAVKEVLKNLKNHVKDNLLTNENAYFLSTKHEEATVHNDSSYDINCLVYLKGDYLINSGTGFYDKFNDKYVLNCHVGFKENRAIIFDSKIYHASLQFNENSNKRYVMVNFFNYK